MMDALGALASLSGGLRTALLAGGVACAAVATADWATRTRRLNPFSGVARFMRAQVDPRLTGIERQVTRAGGHPTTTPWWGLVAYVVIAALLLAVVDMIAGVIREAMVATSYGGAGMLWLIVHWTFAFLRFAIIVRVIGSWFPRAAAGPWMRWSFPATEWLLRPLRRLVPTLGVIDITPIVAYFALQLAEWLVSRILL